MTCRPTFICYVGIKEKYDIRNWTGMTVLTGGTLTLGFVVLLSVSYDFLAANGCLEWTMYRRHDRCKGSRLFLLSRISTGWSARDVQGVPFFQSTEPGFYSAFLWPRPASCQHQGNIYPLKSNGYFTYHQFEHSESLPSVHRVNLCAL